MIEISGDFIILRSESLKDFFGGEKPVHKHILFPALSQHFLNLFGGPFTLPVGYPPPPQLLMQEVKDEGLQSVLILHLAIKQV
jgi:hypothetical protein